MATPPVSLADVKPLQLQPTLSYSTSWSSEHDSEHGSMPAMAFDELEDGEEEGEQ